MKSISILGVFVADLAFFGNQIPIVGETVIGKEYIIGPGGKGSNQAVAAAKAGIKSEIREVSHVGYRGPIMLYPKTVLDNFFGGGLNEGTSGKQLLKG